MSTSNLAPCSSAPWLVSKSGIDLSIYADNETAFDLATVNNGGATANFVANAAVISIAPQMLIALQVIAGWSKCQCEKEHGDNPNCCVLVAQKAIEAAEIRCREIRELVAGKRGAK